MRQTCVQGTGCDTGDQLSTVDLILPLTNHFPCEKGHVQSELILPLTNHFPCEWLWIEAWTEANFCRVFNVPELGHCPFPSSERLVRVLDPVVEPTTAGPGGRIADHSHRSPVGRKPVRDDRSRPAITLHRAFQKPECSPAIPLVRYKNLKHFPFVVNRAPQIAGLPVDPYEHLIKVPAPVRIPMMINPALADLGGKQRTEPVCQSWEGFLRGPGPGTQRCGEDAAHRLGGREA